MVPKTPKRTENLQVCASEFTTGRPDQALRLEEALTECWQIQK